MAFRTVTGARSNSWAREAAEGLGGGHRWSPVRQAAQLFSSDGGPLDDHRWPAKRDRTCRRGARVKATTDDAIGSDLADLRKELEGSGFTFGSVWVSAGAGPTRGTCSPAVEPY